MPTYLIRLPNGTFIGMIKEIQDGIVDTSVAGFNWIPERSEIVDFTQGIYPNVNKIFIRRPTKHDVSLKYFMLGNILRFTSNYFEKVPSPTYLYHSFIHKNFMFDEMIHIFFWNRKTQFFSISSFSALLFST